MLFEHQEQALEFLKSRDRGALLMEMGTGKTRVAIEYILKTRKRPVLVVIPKSVLPAWEKELDLYPRLEVSYLFGKKVDRIAATHSQAPLHIINYEYLWTLLPELQARRYDTIIFDESTMIKSPRAKRTKAATRLADRAARTFLMTGSPVSNSPLDSFCQFRTLGSDVLGDNYWEFRNYHCIMGGYEFYEVIDYYDLESLRDRMGEFSFVRKKSECLDLPPKLFEDRRVSMLPEQREIYKRVKKDLLLELKGIPFLVGNVLTKMLRLSQIAGGHLTMENGSLITFPSCKDDELLRLMDEVGEQKVVVWVRFIHELRKVSSLLKDWGVVSMCGKTKNRRDVIESFQSDPGVRVMVCQIQVGKFGITLTSGTVAVYYSKTYSLEDYSQSQDRIHRIGQEKSVTIVNLNVRGTIDVTLQRALDHKRDLADFVTPSSVRSVLSGSESI